MVKALKKGVVLVVLIAICGLLIYGWSIGLFGGNTAQGQAGAATLAFTVKFADGSSQTFESSNIYAGKLCVAPLSLYVGGKEISSIDVAVKVRLSTGGRTVQSWSASIAQRIEIYKSGQNAPLVSSTGNYYQNGLSWSDGETKTVLTTPLTATTIESAIRQYSGDGDFYFQVVAQISLTVNADGQTFTLAGSGVGGITITMKNYQAMSMSAVVSVTPLSLIKP